MLQLRETKEINEEIIQILYNDGFNDAEIASVFGLARCTICKKRKELGLKKRFYKNE